MSQFYCQTSYEGSVFIIRTNGYLDENGGRQIRKALDEALPKGFLSFMLNFMGSPVINSQGIAQLIELTEIIIDEKKGKVAFVGLNELTLSVFRMVGLLKMGTAYPDENSAIENL